MVLILNRDQAARTWIEATVSSAGLPAFSFESASDLTSQFTPSVASRAILDLSLSDASDFELQAQLSRAGATVMFLTQERCVASSVRALKAGAVNFLTLPCEAADLIRALGNAVRHALTCWSHRQRLIDLQARYQQLTPREREVLSLVVSGMRNKQITHQLDIKHITVQIHRSHVMRKMRAGSLASLVRMADLLTSANT